MSTIGTGGAHLYGDPSRKVVLGPGRQQERHPWLLWECFHVAESAELRDLHIRIARRCTAWRNGRTRDVSDHTGVALSPGLPSSFACITLTDKYLDSANFARFAAFA